MTGRRTVHLIVNPNSGRGGAARAREVERFRELMRGHGVNVELKETAGPNDAARLAAEAAREGFREIIVSGGDGTIHEAIQGLVGHDVRLAIWPAGTANVLARQLGLPFDAVAAAAVFARGRVRRITLGCATSEQSGARRYFFMIAGIGLDASVVRHVRPALKRRVGEMAYWYAGLSHLAHWQPRTFTVEIDGQSYPATYAAVGKAPWYGGGLRITPNARLDAREFEVCLINSHSRLRYLRLLTHAMRGGATEHTRGVRYVRASRVRATGEAGVQADGELIGQLPMTFEIVPEGIEIIVP
ncbi:MAG: diacylglycerol kinase family lipid kinase [Acidobacteria bacterium]|nr:diacylglycerol kinase family lipid kinase [Acidobacteriota bacterium]